MAILRLVAGILTLISCTSNAPRRGVATISSSSAEIGSISSELVVIKPNCSHLKVGETYEVELGGTNLGQVRIESVSGTTAIAKIIRDRDLKKGAKIKAESLPLDVCAVGRGKFANVEACVARISTTAAEGEDCENVEESEQWTHFFEDGKLVAELFRQSCKQRVRWHTGTDWADLSPMDFCTRLKGIEASGKLTEERGSKN